MVYQPPDNRLATYEDRTVEDSTVLVRDPGASVGSAVLAGVLIVIAAVLLVWLLGGSDPNPSGTTYTPVETTLPVETITPSPTAPG